MVNLPIPEHCLSVVMPVYNEENTIRRIVDMVLARPEVGELIVVDDASRDSSWDRLRVFAGNDRVRLLRQQVNQGKGAALIRGFAAAARHCGHPLWWREPNSGASV